MIVFNVMLCFYSSVVDVVDFVVYGKTKGTMRIKNWLEFKIVTLWRVGQISDQSFKIVTKPHLKITFKIKDKMQNLSVNLDLFSAVKRHFSPPSVKRHPCYWCQYKYYCSTVALCAYVVSFIQREYMWLMCLHFYTSPWNLPRQNQHVSVFYGPSVNVLTGEADPCQAPQAEHVLVSRFTAPRSSSYEGSASLPWCCQPLTTR